MTVPIIAELPTPPSRSAPADFANQADAFLGALPGFADDLNTLAQYISDMTAAVYTGTSATSLTIGTGVKTLTVSDMALVPGQTVLISDAANSANLMTGSVVSYDAPTDALVVNVTSVTGAGTKASWIIGLAPGASVALAFISGLAANVAAFLASPSSANLLAMLTSKTGTGNAVFGTAPTISDATLTNPTITGGSIDGATTGVTAASGANDDSIPTNAFVQQEIAAKIAGLSWKQRVRAATTANGALATAFANGQSIDGVALATGDRILIKNQTTGSENGIYVVNAAGAPTRATDADAGPELINASCYVSEGTTQADSQWVCTNNAVTIGTTAIVFAQFSTAPGAIVPVSLGGTGGSTQSAARAGIGAAASGANADITSLRQSVTVTATGAIAADTLGYRGLPERITTGAATLVLADAGGRVTLGGDITIPTNATVALPAGVPIVLVNPSTSTTRTIIPASGVNLTPVGSTSTGNRTLSIRGSATLIPIGTDDWLVLGSVL